MIEEFNNDLNKLKVNNFNYTIKDIENIFRILKRLIEIVEWNKEQEINKEMKNLLPNKDKNWININKKAKENLNIFKEKTDSDMLSEMNTELTIFKDSYWYKETAGYKTIAKNKLEIKGTIEDLKRCVDKRIDNIISSSDQAIIEYDRKAKKQKESVIKFLNIFGIFGNVSDYILKGTFETYCSNNTSFIETTLKCEGTARWDWQECKTTFNITSLKFTIDGSEKNLIQSGKSIDIKKDYVEDSTDGDIKESDILVNLLQNNKLFHTDDNSGNKYVFNKVDLSEMKYYLFASKYIRNNNSKSYNMLYCLKCSLNNITGLYNNSSAYFILDRGSWRGVMEEDCLGKCEQSGHNSTNLYDTVDNYIGQIKFLDETANGLKQNRAPSNYSHKIGQKLFIQDHLSDKWRNKN